MKIEAELQKALRLIPKNHVNCVFEKIYNNYFKLGLFISRQYLNEQDSFEIVQDIFVSFFEKILKEHQCDIQNIKQYLCVSIKNASIRKANEQRNIILFNDDINCPNNEELPHEQIETLFAGLNKEEQYIITEHVLSDKKFKDIAGELNKPIFTISSIYRRGIIKIKRRMKSNEEQNH